MENLNYIPKKYRERVEKLERENGLIDDCKYMLYFNKDWCWSEDYWALPVKSKKEALEYIKEARLRKESEEKKKWKK